eukprot:TRINITY_DN92947_c0_g1_i1.p1 TRINITY_DN92947_c0_g1~~TRINITY_DN92947_c0_g1_i1.p1  ORF type:complete len:280 (+),score=49.40 TRINITY_DN92947_c0_g1_i1:89-841(+)
MDASGLQSPPERLRSPSVEELGRLHQEIHIWMSQNRYQLQPVDNRPIWRVQNTTLTISTGLGVGSFYAMKRFRPNVRFPFDVVVPFLTFFVTHRFAQASQMPGLYDDLLRLPSPLGESARRILGAIRGGGKLPSQDLTGARGQPGRPTADARSSDADAAAEPRAEGWGQVPMPAELPKDAATGAMPAPAASGGSDAFGGSSSSSDGQGAAASWGPVDAGWDGQDDKASAASAPRRKTWDEIRAEIAAKKG